MAKGCRSAEAIGRGDGVTQRCGLGIGGHDPDACPHLRRLPRIFRSRKSSLATPSHRHVDRLHGVLHMGDEHRCVFRFAASTVDRCHPKANALTALEATGRMQCVGKVPGTSKLRLTPDHQLPRRMPGWGSGGGGGACGSPASLARRWGLPCPAMVELTTSVTTPMRAQIEIGLRSVVIVETIRGSPRSGFNGNFV